VGVWVVLLVVGMGLSSGIADVLNNDQRQTNNPESQRAEDLLESRGVREEQPLDELVIVRSETLTVDDEAFREEVGEVLASLRSLGDEVVVSATSFFETDAPSLVSADRRTTLLPVTLAGSVADTDEAGEPFIERIRELEAESDAFAVGTFGFASLNVVFTELAEEDLQAEVRALPVALLVLVLVFAAVVASFVPMIVAFISIIVATGLAALIGQIWPLSFFITNFILSIGLAVGIDYSLFVVERFREERARGRERIDAISVAGDTATRAVLFSGITVVIALFGMFIVPQAIFRSLATGAILVASLAVAAALTLQPALLALLGDRVNSLSVRPTLVAAAVVVVGIPAFVLMSLGGAGGLDAMALTALLVLAVAIVASVADSRMDLGARDWAGAPLFRHGAVDPETGFWARGAQLVMRYRMVSALSATALLVALSISYFNINTGFAGASTLPEDTEPRAAFELLDAEFSAGEATPAEIVIDSPNVAAAPVQEAIQRLIGELEAAPIFGTPTVIALDSPSTALIQVPLRAESATPEERDAILELRDEIIPRTFGGVDAEVLVGGVPGGNTDFFGMVDTFLPLVFAFVLSFSFLLLLLVFRSIVVPVKAIIMNLLSVGAAYGLLVLVFQKGVAADFFGFQTVETVEAWIPLFLFTILFGLSMDYHVFLLSRIRERYDVTHDNRGSVVFGLRSTANIITGAAAIMIVVFGGFAAGQLVPFQQMGFGLSVAILLDATIVRIVLVPATMAMLGDWNWYLPSWLSWLPDLRVEGESFDDLGRTPESAVGGSLPPR
jgi:RND superfamily putative drug exporter